MTYKSHFLTDVILRVDFVAVHSPFVDQLDERITSICKQHFPLVDIRTAQMQGIQLNMSEAGSPQFNAIPPVTTYEWHYFTANRETELAITPTALFITTKAYSTFEAFTAPFLEILNIFLGVYTSPQISRIGLRYIDQIDLSDNRTKKNDWHSYWKKYIATDLLQSLSFVNDDKALARNMGNIEMNYGEYYLKFQYGMFNADYPAILKKQNFILDTDVYAVGQITVDELKQKLVLFHQQSKSWFEKSIKQPLRQKMGVVEDA